MPSILYLLVGLIAGILAAWIFCRLTISTLSAGHRQQKENLENELRTVRDENTGLIRSASELGAVGQDLRVRIEGLLKESAEKNEKILTAATANAELSAANRALRDKLDTLTDEIARIRRESQLEFENIASKILEEKAKRFTETNRENIGNLLRPLGENLDKFRQKVEDTYDKESKERFSLEKVVRELSQMNQRISEEASNLTNALKGKSKIQGDWGEMILENILEQSGLQKNREYFVQETLRDDARLSLKSEEGRRMIPDVVVQYPDRRKVVVDSKVSLTAYVGYTSTDDKGRCEELAAQHVASVRRHVDELQQKNYQAHIESLDFVMMFVPNEPAYMLALQTDPELWNYAYRKGVLIISPTNLITSLRLIHDLWSREYQNRNALEIADRGALLYDKFVGFAENMARIGESIERTRNTYDEAMGQLREKRGNLIGQVDKLRLLGVKARKRLNVIDNEEDDMLEIESQDDVTNDNML